MANPFSTISSNGSNRPSATFGSCSTMRLGLNSNTRNISTGNSRNKKNKLNIKPFKEKPQLPPSFEAETWSRLHSAVIAVQSKEPTKFSREELYRAVEDMCTWKLAAQLYSNLEKTIGTWITSRLDSLETLGSNVNTFLEAIHSFWKDYSADMTIICTIFLYLDRTYVMQTPHLASIWDMGLRIVREQLLRRKSLESKIITSCVDLITQERNGESILRSYLYDLLRMLIALQLYHRAFEPALLSASETYYNAEGIILIDTLSVADFLAHVEKRLIQENERVEHYLDITTKKPLILVVEAKLLEPHVVQLLLKGFEDLMDNCRKHDLRLMYTLFTRINKLPALKSSFNTFIQKRVSVMVQDETEKQLVEKLLSFKAQVDHILDLSFQSDNEFAYALKSAMEHSINVRPNRPAELVAKFVDSKLRTGKKGSSEAEVEILLDQVMVLFRYLQSKDVFEAFYKKDLAKRLLVGKSASFDLEKLMLSKLKTECGSSFTKKLEGMFKDIDLSKNVMVQFQQHAPSRTALSNFGQSTPEMHVMVLTTGFWPPYIATELTLPTKLIQLKDLFDNFYSSKYQGRQLQWQHSLASCVVKAKFPEAGKKELVVSLYQTVVLLCFCSADNISFTSLKEQTQIEDGELRRTLQSLACGKIRVLNKIPRGKDVEDNDQFEFNMKFTSQMYRIKINSIQMKETKKENEQTHERVFRDRQYQVDAAIVRIMKSRKSLTHTALMGEIFAQLKFPANVADIKRRIESLIDREYLARDEGNTQLYNYLA